MTRAPAHTRILATIRAYRAEFGTGRLLLETAIVPAVVVAGVWLGVVLP